MILSECMELILWNLQTALLVGVLCCECNRSTSVERSMPLKVPRGASASVAEQTFRFLSARVLNENFNGTTTNEVRQPSVSLFLVGNM